MSTVANDDAINEILLKLATTLKSIENLTADPNKAISLINTLKVRISRTTKAAN